MRTLDNYIEEGLLNHPQGSLMKNARLEMARELFYNSVFMPSTEEYREVKNIDWNVFKECITLDNAGEMHIDLTNYPKIDALCMIHQAKTPQLNICEIKPASNQTFTFIIEVNFFKSIKGIFADGCRLDCSLSIHSNSYLEDIEGLPEEIYGNFELRSNRHLWNPFKERTPEELHKYMLSIIRPLPKYCHAININWNNDSVRRAQQYALTKHYPTEHLDTRGGFNEWCQEWNKKFAEAIIDHLRPCHARAQLRQYINVSLTLLVEFM